MPIVFMFCLIGCFKSVRFEAKNKKKINNEVLDVVCSLERSGQLSMIVVKCDSYGIDKCTETRIVNGTLEVLAYLESTKDTLVMEETKESVFFFGARDLDKILDRNDRLFVQLKYEVDSLSIIYDKNVVVLLDKEGSHYTSVH